MGGGLNGQDAYSGRILAQNQPCDTDHDKDVATFDPRAIGDIKESDTASTVRANTGGGGETQNPAFVMQAFHENQRAEVNTSDVGYQLTSGGGKPGQGYSAVFHPVPRRLTPLECERLQGFPDDWTQVEWKGKPMSDGPRYKMLGNAVTVNVAHWIGTRIVAVEEYLREHENKQD